MTSFSFDLNGVPEYTRRLRAIRDRASNERSMFQALADRFKDSERSIFASQGASLGRAWTPLSPAYAAAKDREYPGQPILQRTGRLKRSLTETPRIRFRGNTMEIGTDIDYSEWNNDGVPSNNLPARPHVGLTFGHRQAWVNDVREYLVNGRPLRRF